MIDKPSEKEEEYVKRVELERLKKFEAEREARQTAEEKEKAKALHHMKCPKCYGNLKEENFRKQVKIDKCQDCGGVWLDPGELETLSQQEEGFISHFLKTITG